MPKISHSAVVLDRASHQLLLDNFSEVIPPSWRVFAHHMTIKLGELPTELASDKEKRVTLVVTHVGISEMALAVKVSGYYSKNVTPHVTLAVNVEDGGVPKMSNQISSWRPVKVAFELTGLVKEIPYP